MSDNINMNKNIKIIIIGIIIFILFIVGGTYAYMIIAVDAFNGSYVSSTTCFIVDYNVTNADGTLPITGEMFPSSNAMGGLSGKVSLKINNNCEVNGLGTLTLNVTNADNTFFKTVTGHCENSQTLKTITDYTDSSSCTSNGGVWVTNGSALKYAIYDTNEVTSDMVPVSVGYVNKIGSIDIYDNIDLSETIVSYYVYIWLDGNLSDNSYVNLEFVGNVSATAIQTEE